MSNKPDPEGTEVCYNSVLEILRSTGSVACGSAMACFHLLRSGYDTEVIILVYDMETILLYFFFY